MFLARLTRHKTTDYSSENKPDMPDSITITDNRTGDSVEIPITNGSVSSTEWAKLLGETWYHDPGLGNTSIVESSIAEIKGHDGILRYRGYPIEQLAEHSTYLEVAYLLIHGELPTTKEYENWVENITTHTYIHENFRRRFFDSFHYDAHPMGILISTIAALSTFYPEAKEVEDPENRLLQMNRLIAKVPTAAAAAHRYSIGLPLVFPDNELDYITNFLSMMFKVAEVRYECHPDISRCLDILFILHADHGQNCSTFASRVVGSSLADPYSATAAACAALYGPRHGGANEAVLEMLRDIGSHENVEDYIAGIKKGEVRLMGFGHRVYKNYDPRAKIIKSAADKVFEITGKNPLIDIAHKLEETALADEYFISRNLYPNVDFYSGLIYQALGFDPKIFTVLFAIPRTAGWLAHWNEGLEQNARIMRPRQVYTGSPIRDYTPIKKRKNKA